MDNIENSLSPPSSPLSSSSSSSRSSFGLWSSESSGESCDLFDFFDSDSEDDYEPPRKRVCILGYCDNVVQNYSDREFITQFRLERDVVNKLIKLYAESDFYIQSGKKFDKFRGIDNLKTKLHEYFYML